MFCAELGEGPRAAPHQRVARALDAETQHRGDERPCHDVARELFYCRILQLKRVPGARRVDTRENDERDEQPKREDQLDRAVRFGRGPGRVLQPFGNVVVVALAAAQHLLDVAAAPREPPPRLLRREDCCG